MPKGQGSEPVHVLLHLRQHEKEYQANKYFFPHPSFLAVFLILPK